MDNKNEMLKKAEEQSKKLLELLEGGYNLFPSRKVPVDILLSGYTYYKGIVVPTKVVAHRYLYDDYENPFLNAFIALFKKILEESSSYSNELGFRTLLEMGTEDSYVLFDQKVSGEEKRLYTTIVLLADYSSIETAMKPFFVDWFNKLLGENKTFLIDKLNEKQILLLEIMSEIINKKELDEDAYTQATKQIRQMVSDIKANIINYHEQKKN